MGTHQKIPGGRKENKKRKEKGPSPTATHICCTRVCRIYITNVYLALECSLTSEPRTRIPKLSDTSLAHPFRLQFSFFFLLLYIYVCLYIYMCKVISFLLFDHFFLSQLIEIFVFLMLWGLHQIVSCGFLLFCMIVCIIFMFVYWFGLLQFYV